MPIGYPIYEARNTSPVAILRAIIMADLRAMLNVTLVILVEILNAILTAILKMFMDSVVITLQNGSKRC